MTSPTVGGPRSGARSEYGDLLPIRPATGIPTRCLREEYLTHYGMTRPFSHRYRLHCTLCETCRRIEALDPSLRRLAEWAHLDVTVQHPPDIAPQQGLVLVAHPPPDGALTGRIKLALDGTVVGTLTLTCYPACRLATFDYAHVTAGYRRLGYGRTLVAAAHARTTGYRKTAPLPDGPVAQAFRARIAYSRPGAPSIHLQQKRPDKT